ncbi:MAG: sugar phosphate nucleotidyltransferase [Patescibacteria group bacterium]
MKGVILAGGLGTRLRPLTLITNKHLLPVYDKPMILYPLETLKQSGVTDIMIVCGKEHAGHFMNFLGSGKEYNVKLSYALQYGSGGIAEALKLAEDFVDNNKVAVILGDNVFERSFVAEIKKFEKEDGAKVFIKKVANPERFGVVELNKNKIVKIEEKPKKPKSNFITTGFYLYGADVFQKIKKLKPSWRGEFELTDVHNMYIKEGRLFSALVKGYWSDAGTFESLNQTANWIFKSKK